MRIEYTHSKYQNKYITVEKNFQDHLVESILIVSKI